MNKEIKKILRKHRALLKALLQERNSLFTVIFGINNYRYMMFGLGILVKIK
jgi:hypothetical protein